MKGEVASTAHNSAKIAETSARNICGQPPPEKTALRMDGSLKGVQRDPILPKIVTLRQIVGLSQWHQRSLKSQFIAAEPWGEGPALKAINQRWQRDLPAWKLTGNVWGKQVGKLANRPERLRGREVRYCFFKSVPLITFRAQNKSHH